MTEEEAKTKWCPQIRYPNLMEGGMVASNSYSDGCNVNSIGDRTPQAFCCVASDCMMWRWLNEPTIKGVKMNGAVGYCGLAK